MKEIDKTKSYSVEGIKQNELISKILNYTKHLLILASTVTWSVSVTALASLVCIHVGIASFAIKIKITVTTAGVKKYKSIIKNKKRKHDKIVLLANTKLKIAEFLIL